MDISTVKLLFVLLVVAADFWSSVMIFVMTHTEWDIFLSVKQRFYCLCRATANACCMHVAMMLSVHAYNKLSPVTDSRWRPERDKRPGNGVGGAHKRHAKCLLALEKAHSKLFGSV